MLNRNHYKKGQNTAEYLIMLVLVAVGSIALFGTFGKMIQRQFKNAMVSIEGGTEYDANEVGKGFKAEETSMNLVPAKN